MSAQSGSSAPQKSSNGSGNEPHVMIHPGGQNNGPIHRDVVKIIEKYKCTTESTIPLYNQFTVSDPLQSPLFSSTDGTVLIGTRLLNLQCSPFKRLFDKITV
jgi:hypothetical protein